MLVMTWNCWRVTVVGAQDGSTWTTRCWRRSAVATVVESLASSDDDVDGFSLKKSVRIRSTWAFHSRRRRSILPCISSQAVRCLSLSSCALSPFVVVVTVPLSAVRQVSAGCRRSSADGENSECEQVDGPRPSVELDVNTSSTDDRVLARSTASRTSDEDKTEFNVGHSSEDADGVVNPFEALHAGSTTNESIRIYYLPSDLWQSYSCNE